MRTARTIGGLGALLAAVAPATGRAAEPAPRYAVVVSEQTRSAPGWNRVVEALRAKHGAEVIAFRDAVDEALPALRRLAPRHACFVAQPAEAGRAFVARVHRLTRRLDDDPYADVLWGILTGYDAANALRIAELREPLTIRKVASGTEVALEACEEGVWYSELKKGHGVRKARGGEPRPFEAPADSTEALVRTLTEYRADCFVTSGHATERDWQIGYTYRNGTFRCAGGELFGLDTKGGRHPVRAPNPKVYLPIGNCLMGHIDGSDAMALAFLNSAGVRQMIGYTVPTWYGYAGWGCLDYFLEQPGRHTFVEAFFANHHALVHRLTTHFPDLAKAEPEPGGRRMPRPTLTGSARAAGLTARDGIGLLHDRDVVALYGDPAWVARMAAGRRSWDQVLRESDGVFTLEIIPRRGAASFAPVNTNGAQRGGRPVVHFLPRRVGDVRLLEGADLAPVIADDFVLVPLPRTCDPERTYRVVFRTTSR
jgi:zinc protease